MKQIDRLTIKFTIMLALACGLFFAAMRALEDSGMHSAAAESHERTHSHVRLSK
jgi:hypothetical protein